MKNSTKKILILFIITLIFIFLIRFVFDIFKIKEYSFAIILLISYIFSIILLGRAKIRNTNELKVLLAIISFSLLYQVVTFVFFGIKVGFLSSSYKYGIEYLIKIMLPITLIIVLSELLRYQVITKGKSSKLVIITSIIFFTTIDIVYNSSLYNFISLEIWFDFITLVIAPSIIKNLFLTFISYHYSCKSTISYRIIMELSIYILPIIPDINKYLQSILLVIFPFVLFLYFMFYTENTELVQKKEEQKKSRETSKLKIIGKILSIIILLIYIGMMSGLFKYYFLVVGSGSMEPSIYRGDMIIVEKINDPTELKIQDVLVYKHSDKVILHRIIDIRQIDNDLVFKTKGDNNNAEDAWEISSKDIIGKTRFRLPKLGYPTIWLNDILKGEK